MMNPVTENPLEAGLLYCFVGISYFKFNIKLIFIYLMMDSKPFCTANLTDSGFNWFTFCCSLANELGNCV